MRAGVSPASSTRMRPGHGSRALASLAYENAGREITQAFETLNSNLTLAAGALGALLAVLGAGELFGRDTQAQPLAGAPSPGATTLLGIPRLSDVSVLLLAAAFPLLGRFFIRATFGYQQLLRFNLVQRTMWEYLGADIGWEIPGRAMELYIQRWKSPQSAHSLLWGSFKYGFVWVFVLAAIALGWGLASAPGVAPRLVAAVFALGSVAIEGAGFFGSKYVRRPTEAERKPVEDIAEGRGWPNM